MQSITDEKKKRSGKIGKKGGKIQVDSDSKLKGTEKILRLNVYEASKFEWCTNIHTHTLLRIVAEKRSSRVMWLSWCCCHSIYGEGLNVCSLLNWITVELTNVNLVSIIPINMNGDLAPTTSQRQPNQLKQIIHAERRNKKFHRITTAHGVCHCPARAKVSLAEFFIGEQSTTLKSNCSSNPAHCLLLLLLCLQS